MSNAKSKQAKPKTGLARCMELASDRKGLIFLAAVLSSLAAIASFIPYIAVYFMIRSIIGVFPNLDQLDMGMVMNYGWLALAGIVAKTLPAAHLRLPDFSYNTSQNRRSSYRGNAGDWGGR